MDAPPDRAAPATRETVDEKAAGAGSAGQAQSAPARIAARPSPTVPPTSTPDPFAERGAPARLVIPSIRVDTNLEPVGSTDKFQVEVPRDIRAAGWYRLGAYPGELGRALINGHLDGKNGQPAVFWDLNEVKLGDEVVVTYANGDRFRFVVDGQTLVDYGTAEASDMELIAGLSDVARLTLMTCDGAWDHGKATYSKRLVVSAALQPDSALPPPQ